MEENEYEEEVRIEKGWNVVFWKYNWVGDGPNRGKLNVEVSLFFALELCWAGLDTIGNPDRCRLARTCN